MSLALLPGLLHALKLWRLYINIYCGKVFATSTPRIFWGVGGGAANPQGMYVLCFTLKAML
jgi:hypothetical protein